MGKGLFLLNYFMNKNIYNLRKGFKLLFKSAQSPIALIVSEKLIFEQNTHTLKTHKHIL